MANLFVTKSDLTLKAGSYLVATSQETPVNHEEFVTLQKEAHMLVNLATRVKDTDFTAKKVKTYQDVVNEVTKELHDESKKYVTAPAAVERPLTDQLANEAMNWIKGQEAGTKADKLNRILQRFNILQEFSDFGLYFTTDKIVRLSKIYSIEEVVSAVTILEPFLTA